MKKKELTTRCITGAVIGLVVFALLLIFPPLLTTLALTGCLIWILRYEWPAIAKPWGKHKWLLTLFYPILPFYALIEINRADQTMLAVLILLVFACDTGAYFFGTLFGKRLLAPSISPKKTWEGLLGGILTTNLVIIFLHTLLKLQTPLMQCLLFGTTVALLAITGDLFESWLKRKAKIKDTGTLLPGHGGLLDRFDSILFVAPFYYYFLL